MRNEDVRAVLKAEPFVPFALRLVDGGLVRIDHPEYVLLPPGHRAIAIFPKIESQEGLRYFDIGLIVGLELDPPRDPAPPREDAENGGG